MVAVYATSVMFTVNFSFVNFFICTVIYLQPRIYVFVCINNMWICAYAALGV